MKILFSRAFTVLLVCLLTVPVFAYSAWQPEVNSTVGLEHGTSVACVYTYGDQVVRDSRNSNWTVCDAVKVEGSAMGFRLPTNAEWQLVARYIDGKSWFPGDHVSGDISGPCWSCDGKATWIVFGDFAWYWSNSGLTTNVVEGWSPNALGIYDMSGNVLEWF